MRRNRRRSPMTASRPSKDRPGASSAGHRSLKPFDARYEEDQMLFRAHLPLALLLLLPSLPAAAQPAAANRCTAPAHRMEAKGDPRLVEAVKAGNTTLVRELLGK